MTTLNLGNSVNNIQITENILSEEEHKKLLNYVEIVEDWHTQPWGVKTLAPMKQTFQTVILLDKIFMIAHKKCVNFYGADLYDFDRGSVPLVKFEKNYKMNEHADTTGDIAALYYINDDYDGGEINFMDFGLKIKPKANSLITFPSNSDYWHEVLENTGKERYSATTWFKFAGSSLERPQQGLLR